MAALLASAGILIQFPGLPVARAFIAAPSPVFFEAREIDRENSKVTFEISNIGINTVRGSFTGMTGEIRFDPQDPGNASFEVCIDASTIDTGIGLRDRDLQGEKFFHVERYPEICFRSGSVRREGDGYVTAGELTMAGVTRTEEIPFTFADGTFEGTFTVNRFDFGVGEDVSKFTAGAEVTVTIRCETVLGSTQNG